MVVVGCDVEDGCGWRKCGYVMIGIWLGVG